MAFRSRRCAVCDLNLPKSYNSCPVCHRDTFEHDQAWTQNWSQEANRLKRIRSWRATGQVPNVYGVIVEKDGHLFIAENYLEEAGYEPHEFDVVKIHGKYYELQGRVGDEEITGWWLALINVEAEVARLTDQHPVLSEKEYQELERARGVR